MKTILLIFSLLFFSSPVTRKVADRKGIPDRIRAWFDAECTSWNRGDLEGYLTGYWDSEKTRWVSGAAVVRGKKAIAAAYRSRFPSAPQMGNIEVTDLEIEVLTSTDVLVFGHLVHTVGKMVRNGVFTVQLRKIGEDWLIVSDHSSTGG
jgi:hypothetical protein